MLAVVGVFAALIVFVFVAFVVLIVGGMWIAQAQQTLESIDREERH